MTDVDVRLFRPSDAPDMTRLLGEVFAERDPPAVAVGVTAPEFEAFAGLWVSNVAAEGLTFVARSTTTGQMVGALLAEDAASAPPDGLDAISEQFLPIFDILGQLDAEYREGRAPVTPGTSIHLMLLGVTGDAAGKGLAQQLVTTCLAHAASKGYRLGVTEATNRTSQHVFRKLGFVERVSRSYADHRVEGRAYFASIADHGGPMLMDKDIS